MAGPLDHVKDLNTWKEIADYLGVSVRTAQTLEKDKGLPVRRRGVGHRAPVSANIGELADWKSRTVLAGSATSVALASLDQPGGLATSEQKLALNPFITKRLTRRRLLLYGAIPGLVLTGAALVMSRVRSNGRAIPNAARVVGSTLVVSSSEGDELWRHTFRDRLGEWFPAGSLGAEYCVFADIDGDGGIETIFKFLAPVGTIQRLICFNRFGKILWEFIPGRTVVDIGFHQYLPPYGIRSFAPIPGAGPTAVAQVVVASAHNWSFPCQVALLDGKTGRLTSEYWHRGHLDHIVVEDIDGDGEPEILLGGVNDALEYKRATVVVFDHRKVTGACRNPKGGVYFQGMPAGSEKAVVFFPRSPVSRDEEFNRVVNLHATDGRIIVGVAEGVHETDPTIIYEFDYTPRPTNAAFSGDMIQRWRQLQAAGKIEHGSEPEVAKRLMAQVKVVRFGG